MCVNCVVLELSGVESVLSCGVVLFLRVPLCGGATLRVCGVFVCNKNMQQASGNMHIIPNATITILVANVFQRKSSRTFDA